MSTERVLFIVYEFPPEGCRGTKRSLKFIRYLPRNRWQPVILTVQTPNYSFHDASLIEELPANLPIYRARTFESWFSKSTPKSTPEEPRGSKPGAHTRGPSVFRRLATWLYHAVGKFAKIPDSRILWLPCAVIKGLHAIRENNCRVLYSSGPTHTNHFVGAILSRLTGLPLIMDFRDAWVADPASNQKNLMVRRGNSLLEKWCVRVAKTVVCTTEGIQADFETRYPSVSQRYITITNGFDSTDFAPSSPRSQSPGDGVLRVLHAGTLGGERSPKEFLEAVGQLLKEKPEISRQLEVIFVGQNSPFTDGKTIEAYLTDYDCGSVVKIAGYVSRSESLQYMEGADVLLMVVGRVPRDGAFVYGISGKIYDYAAAGKPVLTISEPGATAAMATRLSLGPVVHPDHTAEIKAALLALCEAHRSGGVVYKLNSELLQSFEFTSLTARLAKCFDELARATAPQPDPATGLVQSPARRA
jgi:glycosyltransferase involved in cell wall biosynthesis